MTSFTRRSFQCAFLCLLCSLAMLIPVQSRARNGDDWVLVERFNAQLKQAEGGDANAMFEVARMYQRGRGTEPNLKQSVRWLHKAIAKDQNDARALLGEFYLDGTGVQRNPNQALSLIRPAAQAGVANAQYTLGLMYEQGNGVRKDLNQAMYWYKQAAKNGHYLAVDRVKQLETRRAEHRTQAAANNPTPPAKPVTRADSPALVLLRTVLQANWQRHNKPSSFLPSANTQCKQQGSKKVLCRSGELTRKTYDAIISYTTESTLTGFNNADAFEVSYVNTVLKVEPIARETLDGENTTPRRPPNIPLGKQPVTHTLQCELNAVDKLVCVKDNATTDTFTRGN